VALRRAAAHRQRERMKVVVPLTVAAIGLGIAANVAAGGGFGMVVWNIHRVADWIYLRIMGAPQSVFGRAADLRDCGPIMQAACRHIQFARLVPINTPRWRRRELPALPYRGAQLPRRTRRHNVLRQGLTYLNLKRGGRRRARTRRAK